MNWKELLSICIAGIVLLGMTVVFFPKPEKGGRVGEPRFGVLQKTKEYDINDVRHLMREAEDEWRQTNYARAHDIYSELYKKYFFYPYDAGTLKDYIPERLARVCQQLGQHEDALFWYAEAMTSPIVAIAKRAYFEKGLLFYAQGREDEALDLWFQALDSFDGDVDYDNALHRRIAYAYLVKKDLKKSAFHYRQLSFHEESDLIALAEIYKELKDYYRAYRYYQKAARMHDTKEGQYVDEAGECLRLLQDQKAAPNSF